MAESSCTTLILSIVNLSMCYSGTPLREQRKTLQNYKFYLKPANFSRYFFQLFFGSSEALRPSPDRLRLGGTSVPKASAKLHLSPIPSKYFPEKVHQNYVFKHIFNIRLQLHPSKTAPDAPKPHRASPHYSDLHRTSVHTFQARAHRTARCRWQAHPFAEASFLSSHPERTPPTKGVRRPERCGAPHPHCRNMHCNARPAPPMNACWEPAHR